MHSIRCSDVFAHLIDQSNLAPQSPAIIEHIGSCPACGARLLALFQLLGAPQLNADDCAVCLDQLDALVDEELLDPLRAMRWYPAAWSHLWVCAKCLETYDMLKSLASLLQPPIRPPVRAPEAPRPEGIVRFRRRALQAALPPMAAFRSVYGHQAQAYQLLAGKTSVGEQIVMYDVLLRKIAADRSSVTVALNPALDYTVTLAVDDYVASARLGPPGIATIEIPDAYVDNVHAGDWLIRVSPAEE